MKVALIGEKIRELENSGYIVDITHSRYILRDSKLGDTVLPQGGYTRVCLEGLYGAVTTYYDFADNQNFNKKLAIAVALGKAIKEYNQKFIK